MLSVYGGAPSTEFGRLEMFELACHRDHPASSVRAIQARIVGIDSHWLTLRWRIEGAGTLVVPVFAGKRRADGLWRTTCFELFMRAPGAAEYCEFNLSPSERWAAYDFTAYRDGMTERAMPRDPVCTLRQGQELAIFDAAIPLDALPPLPWDYSLTAVIEEEGGQISYWAIAHPPGKPDFHHPACFAAALAPPSQA